MQKDSLVRLVRVLMLTGCRYEEIKRLKSCPECFNESDRSVWIRSGKLKARSPERYIPLTAAGVDAVQVFLDDLRMKYTGPATMGINLRVETIREAAGRPGLTQVFTEQTASSHDSPFSEGGNQSNRGFKHEWR